jgi:hypothetical protein
MKTALALTSLLALLTACGGGGDDAGSTDNVGQETATAMSANSAVVPADSAEAAATVLVTTQAVVAGGQASQTYNCVGGGTALFTVTGGSVASITNDVLDAGEVYSVSYTACRGSAGAASLDGTATLTVVSAAAGVTDVSTATQGIVVTLPQRTLTLNGNSTLSQTVVTNGATATTTSRWTSPQIVVTSQRNARSSSFTLTNVDLTRSIAVTGGVISARSNSGTHTMSAVLPNASWTITTATQGAVSYDANGVPTQGAWTITLPNNRIGVSVVPGTLTLTLDYGADGTIDRTYTFSATTLVDEAG